MDVTMGRFVGENGTLVVDREGWEVIPEEVNGQKRMEAVPLKNGTGKGLNKHVTNFIECMNKRNPKYKCKCGDRCTYRKILSSWQHCLSYREKTDMGRH